MSDLGSFVKRLRDIMRNDAGINGDAQRIEQIAWMLFLKVYDSKEDDWEFDEEDYVSIIPEECRWRNWAHEEKDESGKGTGKTINGDTLLTGDKLLDFVNNTLFPTLKKLEVTPETPIKKAIVRTTFEDVRLFQIRDYGDSPVPVYVDKSLVSKFTKKGDILLARYGGSLGKIFWAEDGAYNVAMAKVIPLFDERLIDKNYIYLYYHSDLCQSVILKSSRSAQAGFNKDDLDSMWFPLPPLAEQKRIVAKIEELMPFVEKYSHSAQSLTTLNSSFPSDLKKSILQLAVEGKLVPQDPNDEPASVLLEKIKAEKEKLVKEGKIKKLKPLPPITDDEIPFDIPESWEWCRLGEAITDTEAGKSPQCVNRPAHDDEWGVIKTTAIQDGYFLEEENKVLPEDFEVRDNQVVHAEDLLITRAGPQNRTGITCIVDREPHNLILSDKTVRLAYVRGLVNAKYLMYAIKSPSVQNFVTETKSGMAASQVNISQDKMKLFMIPMPPLKEQDRIVDHLDSIIPIIEKVHFEQ